MRPSRGTLLTLVMIGVLSLIDCGHASKKRAQGQSSSAQATENSPAPTPTASTSIGDSQQAANQAVPPAAAPHLTPSATLSPAPLATYRVTIPDGTPIEVRLRQSLGSARSESGEVFQATLVAPLMVRGEYVVPSGTRVTGRVLLARPSGHLKTPAALAITLTSFKLDGQRYHIATSRRSWRARSHKKHDAKWIAGLSGAGAVFGALVGHGEGALFGAGIGAGGGTATAYATGRKNIILRPETRLRFILRQPVTIIESQHS